MEERWRCERKKERKEKREKKREKMAKGKEIPRGIAHTQRTNVNRVRHRHNFLLSNLYLFSLDIFKRVLAIPHAH